MVMADHGANIRRVVAPNASPMTFRGTNTYILGHGKVAIIDPGPADEAHLAAIEAALHPGEAIGHIFVTHSHLDHSPLARVLGAGSGAPVLGFGASHDGRSETMQRLALSGDVGGGEGIDPDFQPDLRLKDGDVVSGQDWQVTALHTPGHLSNHMCYAFEGGLFSGDHVMGWASTLVSPPDGDIGDFLTSCAQLMARNDAIYYPGHGDRIEAPRDRVEWLIEHRNMRETQICGALESGPMSVAELTENLYRDVPANLHPAAARNVLAHLVHLWEQDRVTAHPTIGVDAEYRLR